MRGLQSPGLFFAAIVLAAAILPSPVAGQENEPQRQKKVYVRTGQEATITGTIHFDGKAPKRWQIDMSQDGECVKSNRKPLDDRAIVTNGNVANVFIYVKSEGALDAYTFEPPSSPAVLDQKRCRFVPHILGMQAGQKLNVLNSDNTTHNVNMQAKFNEKSNASHLAGGEPIVRTFFRPETMIPIKCNQHPWMKAYVNVMSHPFFAVSSRDGSYRIEGLPPGEYTIVAWHESFGEQSVRLTIVPYESRPLDFTFKGEDKD